MKVVILHQHFKDPQQGGAIRSYYLARALAAAGHDVTVISGHNGRRAQQTFPGFTVHWLPVKYSNDFGFSSRILSFLRYLAGVIARPALFRDADLCYAISVPLTTGLAALYVKWFFRIPYVFEVGDLWPDVPVQLGFIRNRMLIRALLALERKIYRGATCLVSLSPAISAVLESKVPAKKIVLIPNMSDTCFFGPVDRESGAPGLVVSYIGALGFANGLEFLLTCAQQSQESDLPIHFNICGEGAFAEELRRMAADLSLRNVTFTALQNREGVRALLNKTDAVMVSYRPFPLLETGSPNKYFDGLAAGKMIITNFGGWIGEEIAREGCGVTVDPNDAGTFLRVISPFLHQPGLLTAYQRNARRLAEMKYSRKQLGEKFVQALKEAVNSASSR